MYMSVPLSYVASIAAWLMILLAVRSLSSGCSLLLIIFYVLYFLVKSLE